MRNLFIIITCFKTLRGKGCSVASAYIFVLVITCFLLVYGCIWQMVLESRNQWFPGTLNTLVSPAVNYTQKHWLSAIIPQTNMVRWEDIWVLFVIVDCDLVYVLLMTVLVIRVKNAEVNWLMSNFPPKHSQVYENAWMACLAFKVFNDWVLGHLKAWAGQGDFIWETKVWTREKNQRRLYPHNKRGFAFALFALDLCLGQANSKGVFELFFAYVVCGFTSYVWICPSPFFSFEFHQCQSLWWTGGKQECLI